VTRGVEPIEIVKKLFLNQTNNYLHPIEELETFFGELEMLKSALNLSAIVAFTDEHGHITHVNENFCKISGFTKDELLGQTHKIVNSNFHPNSFFKSMWKTLLSGQTWRGEIKNKRKDGTYYWVDTTIVPFSKAGPYNSRYVAIRNDITQEKLTQEKLIEQQIRTLESEKMASLGELTSGIAHELGNPIATIHGRAEMLLGRACNEEGEFADYVKNTAERILSVSQRMVSILNSMQAFARSSDQDPFQLISLNRLIKDTLEFGYEKYKKKGIHVTLNMTDQSDIFLECKETQIIQILVNLINNSCDAIQNLPEKWIRISTKSSQNQISIFVTDSGNGISENLREKIFSQFFTTKETGKGTGLGLYLARSFAREHSGDLTIDETHPNTCFELRLPQRQPK